jgi:putative nucleotidyltransferase with HDIG domain
MNERPLYPEPERQHPIGKHHTASLWRYVPHVLLTTFAVVVLPVLIVTLLRTEQIVEGIVPLLFAGLAISIAISFLGSAIWKTRPGSGDLLFGDLIVWGFMRRWLVDHRLSSATKILGKRDEGGEVLTSAERVELLEKLSTALEARDPYTHGHSRRVARHSTTMAKQMGLSREQISKIRTAAAIHDVGKVDTPREVLGKEGKLTDDEYEVIKEHPVVGAEMASDLRDPELTAMVRHHHERLDGRGYPDRLRGAEIPIGARIIAVADTFDAITSARPYRGATAHKKALDVLQSESGSQLDPDAVDAFRSYYSGFRPVAIWAVIANLPQRLFAGVFDGLGAGVASASKAVATTAVVVAGAAATQTVDLAAPDSSSASGSAAEPVLTATLFPGPTFEALPGLPGGQESPDQQGGPSPLGSGATVAAFARGPLKPGTPDYSSAGATPGSGYSGGDGPASEASRDPDDRGPKGDAPAQEPDADEPARSEEPTRDPTPDTVSAEHPSSGNSGNGGNSGGAGNGGDDNGNGGNSGGNPGKGGPTSGSNPGKGGGPPADNPGKGNGPPSDNPGQGGGNSGGGNPGKGGGPPSESPGQGSGPPSGGGPGNGGAPPGAPSGNTGAGGGPPSGGPPGNSGSSGSSAPPGNSGSSGSSGSPGNSGSAGGASGGGPPPGAGKHST